jgi:hypothetical protein
MQELIFELRFATHSVPTMRVYWVRVFALNKEEAKKDLEPFLNKKINNGKCIRDYMCSMKLVDGPWLTDAAKEEGK